MSVESEIALNAYVLLQVHELESKRDNALRRGDKKEADYYSKIILTKINTLKKQKERMRREEEIKKLEEERKKMETENLKKKKGFFARLFNI